MHYIIITIILFVVELISIHVGEMFNSILVAVCLSSFLTGISISMYVIYCLTGGLYA